MPEAKKSPLQGLVLVDKPSGMSSHDVVEVARSRFGIRRVGHTGTLDPFATGLLIVLVGEATKLQSFFLKQDKTYDATFCLGVETDTLDCTGNVVKRVAVPRGAAERESIERAISQHFVGEQHQKPPNYSAVKVSGRPAYAIMRSGPKTSLNLPERRIVVRSFELKKVHPAGHSFTATLCVSSGTYIRSLARDLGQKLGTVGSLGALRRTRIGSYGAEGASSLEGLGDALQPIEAVLDGEELQLSAEQCRKLQHGDWRAVMARRLGEKRFVKAFYKGRLMGVLERCEDRLNIRMNLGKFGDW